VIASKLASSSKASSKSCSIIAASRPSAAKARERPPRRAGQNSQSSPLHPRAERQPVLERLELLHERRARAPRLDEHAPGDLVRRAPLRRDGGLEGRVDALELPFEGLDVPAHEEELALDLLDREALRHQPPHVLELPHRRRRIEPERAAMLALAPDAHAPRQEA